MALSDSELLKKADGYDCWYSDYEKNALDSMMKSVAAGMPLTPRQRAWAEGLIDQLEDRRSNGGGGDDDL